ncbi:hypothetical protein [Propionivibrio sp.]|uniref:hypothetical protein n=1 Tax=Propionivibrio sp. TaxID=2212460 RepID=UPI003BF35320
MQIDRSAKPNKPHQNPTKCASTSNALWPQPDNAEQKYVIGVCRGVHASMLITALPSGMETGILIGCQSGVANEFSHWVQRWFA